MNTPRTWLLASTRATSLGRVLALVPIVFASIAIAQPVPAEKSNAVTLPEPTTLPNPADHPSPRHPADPHRADVKPRPLAVPHPSELATASDEVLATIAPPESGLEVTPGHVIRGCVQVPIYEPRGPYVQVLWPNGDIPFEFDGNVTQANRDAMLAAMNTVESIANINFVARDWFHLSWLHVQNSTGNNAPVGIRPGEMIVNIANWNVPIIMVHELYHAMGVYHEQSRPDRDNFVSINAGNICQNCCSGGPCNNNFDREDGASTYGLYNFDSFMHYPSTAFAIGSTTTIDVNPSFAAIWQNRIGQRDRVSFGDRSTLIRMYQPGWAKVAKINSHPNGPGTFSSPYNNFPDAYEAAPTGGDVLVEPGYYTGLRSYTRAMRIHAANGGVRIGQ